MNKITTNTDPEAAVRYLESQPVRYGATRRPYIPLGCDQQGRVKPTLLDDAQLAPTEQDIGEAIGTVVGFVLLILAFIGGLSWLLSPQGRAFFSWAGKTLAGWLS